MRTKQARRRHMSNQARRRRRIVKAIQDKHREKYEREVNRTGERTT
jgi:hypothetical protein